MENKLVLKRVAVAMLIFGTLVFVVEELLYGKGFGQNLGSDMILFLILIPVGLLGYGRHVFDAHPVYLFGMNAAIYAIIFAIITWLVMSMLTKMKKNQ